MAAALNTPAPARPRDLRVIIGGAGRVRSPVSGYAMPAPLWIDDYAVGGAGPVLGIGWCPVRRLAYVEPDDLTPWMRPPSQDRVADLAHGQPTSLDSYYGGADHEPRRRARRAEDDPALADALDRAAFAMRVVLALPAYPGQGGEWIDAGKRMAAIAPPESIDRALGNMATRLGRARVRGARYLDALAGVRADLATEIRTAVIAYERGEDTAADILARVDVLEALVERARREGCVLDRGADEPEDAPDDAPPIAGDAAAMATIAKSIRTRSQLRGATRRWGEDYRADVLAEVVERVAREAVNDLARVARKDAVRAADAVRQRRRRSLDALDQPGLVPYDAPPDDDE